MTKVWLDAGYRTERVNVESGKVVFRRTRGRGDENQSGASDNVIDRLQAALGGTVRVAPGVDLCEPTGEIWDAERL
jgi:hypothetical protein